ncbi:uncharacterized protein LOC129748194 [Uranotaenia lowii]|uniref:uncharacterized protein LOC129748194 n=1 Tax=Uranotaenia lowii TaxID=190385 RepID=UPI0024786E9B|nr:uncharacterized protein LOC129748194 [Uranotaenia lowii]
MEGLQMVAFLALFLVTSTVLAINNDPEFAKRKLDYKRKCAKVLSTPKEDFKKYLRSQYSDDHDSFCFFRCVMIMDGSYDDEAGPIFDKMFGYIGDGMSREEFQTYYGSCWNEGNELHGGRTEPCICWKAYRKHQCLYQKFLDRQMAKGGN